MLIPRFRSKISYASKILQFQIRLARINELNRNVLAASDRWTYIFPHDSSFPGPFVYARTAALPVSLCGAYEAGSKLLALLYSHFPFTIFGCTNARCLIDEIREWHISFFHILHDLLSFKNSVWFFSSSILLIKVSSNLAFAPRFVAYVVFINPPVSPLFPEELSVG